MNNSLQHSWDLHKSAAPRCPLDSSQLSHAVHFAISSPSLPSHLQPAQPLRRRSLRPFVSACIAAACLAALVIPLTLMPGNNRVETVNFDGQKVRFLCNNHCNANNVISSFNNHLHNQ